MDENEEFLLLFLHCTAVTVSQSCSDGAVEIFGVETDTLIAGRLEICVDGQWFAVYDWRWGDDEAAVVCRQKGFGDEEDSTIPCRESCFGASQLTQGYQDFRCRGNENTLSDCGRLQLQSQPNHSGNTGVMCRRKPGQAISHCHVIPFQVHTSDMTTPFYHTPTTRSGTVSDIATPDMTTPPDYASGFITYEQDTGMDNMTLEDKNRTAIAILGVLSTILLLTLVGVVMGWVWSCYRKRREMMHSPSNISTSPLPKDEEIKPNSFHAPSSLPTEMEPNSCYASTSQPITRTEPNPCYTQTTPTLSLLDYQEIN